MRGLACLAALLLAGFWSHYLRVLEREGSRSASAFWTGPIEPKEAAYDQFAAIIRTEGPIRVVAEDWWLYWPVAYLAAGQPLKLINAERGLPGAQQKGDYWLVYAGSQLDRRIAATAGARLSATIDATGHPKALHIWQSAE